MAGTVALRTACRRVVGGYVVIGLPEPFLVFCGSDTVSAHAVVVYVHSSASSTPAIERAAIFCERVVLRYGRCPREVYPIVQLARTRVNVVESAFLVAWSTRERVRDSGWCVERHVYTRQQNDVQVTRNATYTWMYTVVRYVV